MVKKNTLSILETIKNKLNKLDDKSAVEGAIESDGEFDYVPNSKKAELEDSKEVSNENYSDSLSDDMDFDDDLGFDSEDLDSDKLENDLGDDDDFSLDSISSDEQNSPNIEDDDLDFLDDEEEDTINENDNSNVNLDSKIEDDNEDFSLDLEDDSTNGNIFEDEEKPISPVEDFNLADNSTEFDSSEDDLLFEDDDDLLDDNTATSTEFIEKNDFSLDNNSNSVSLDTRGDDLVFEDELSDDNLNDDPELTVLPNDKSDNELDDEEDIDMIFEDSISVSNSEDNDYSDSEDSLDEDLSLDFVDELDDFNQEGTIEDLEESNDLVEEELSDIPIESDYDAEEKYESSVINPIHNFMEVKKASDAVDDSFAQNNPELLAKALELMEPKLEEWIKNNLGPIVENVVREEIRYLVSKEEK